MSERKARAKRKQEPTESVEQPQQKEPDGGVVVFVDYTPDGAKVVGLQTVGETRVTEIPTIAEMGAAWFRAQNRLGQQG